MHHAIASSNNARRLGRPIQDCREIGKRSNCDRFDRYLCLKHPDPLDRNTTSFCEQMRGCDMAIAALTKTHADAAALLEAVEFTDMWIGVEKGRDIAGFHLLAPAKNRLVRRELSERIELWSEKRGYDVGKAAGGDRRPSDS